MHVERECDSITRFGVLSWEMSERLAGFSGSSVRYSRSENALVVNAKLLSACPPMTGVSCELISFLDVLPDDCRRAMPGGTLFVRDRAGSVQVLRPAAGL